MEKLTRSDVIPDEFTTIKNIVDRYIDKNDGYQALYEILEPHHGLLQKRIKIRPPQSADFGNDIHEYTTLFNTFLISEQLQGLWYSKEKKVTTFLLGLDAYFQPAVAHIENLLDSWGQTGMNPKCEPHKLPSTIDEFMSRNHPKNGQYAVVHTLAYPPNIQSPTTLTTPDNDIFIHITKQQQKDLQEPRKSVDIYCDACGGYGHPWRCCDFLAKTLKAAHFMTNLDKTKQIEIVTTFAKEQQCLRDNKIKWNIGKARILKDNGDIEGLYNLLLTNAEGDDDFTPKENDTRLGQLTPT